MNYWECKKCNTATDGGVRKTRAVCWKCGGNMAYISRKKKSLKKYEYKKYLASSDWKNKKIVAYHLHGKRCAICRSKKVDVHHKTYKRLGNEKVKRDLIPLCRFHHFAAHERASKTGKHIYQATVEYIADNKNGGNRKRKPTLWRDMSYLEKEKILNSF